MQTITITAGALRSYLNKGLVFVNKTKMGISPVYACLYLFEDKARVFNGETGAEIFMPFRIEQPTLFMPFDLAQIANNVAEDVEMKLNFDFAGNECKVKAKSMNIKFRLLDPTMAPTIPAFPTEGFEVNGLRDKLKRASQYTSADASLPGFQAVKVLKTHLCATDRNSLWRESLESTEEFTIPRLLVENIMKIPMDATRFALTDNHIFITYQDMSIMGVRLPESDEKNIFPKSFQNIFAKTLSIDSTTEVAFDREELSKNLEFITGLDLPDASQGAIQLDIAADGITMTTLNKDSAETEGVAIVACTATDSYKELYLNSKLFARALQFFHRFEFKEDANALYFKAGDRECILTRRKVR